MISKSFRAALLFAILIAGLSVVCSRTKAHAQELVSTNLEALASANIIYSQPPNSGGGLLPSSWWNPNGSDYDTYVWDAFTLQTAHAIGEIRWRGGYDLAHGSGIPVQNFSVAIYPSTLGGVQPDVLNPPLVQYRTGGNAGETLAGTFGGTPMYDYTFTLPKAFQAAAGTKYWVQIEAFQSGLPDWGITLSVIGDGEHFRQFASVGDIFYQTAPGDAAFTLVEAIPSLTVTSQGANDGRILESSESSGIGGSINANATTFQLGDDALNRQYRAILSFNTSKLPDTAVIKSAVLKIKKSGTPTGSNPFTILGKLLVDISNGSFGMPALETTDFEAGASAVKVATFNKTPVNGWYSATLNLSGRNNINKTGITQFRLYFTTPSDKDYLADFMKFVSGNGANNKPTLVITYTP